MESLYKIITWPDIQQYMDEEGFEENCCLADSEYFQQEYGPSAYFCNAAWLHEKDGKMLNQ